MRWNTIRRAVATAAMAPVVVAGCLVASSGAAAAAEAPTCFLEAENPQQAGPNRISGIGRRQGCVQNRSQVTVRIRRDISFWPDETVAQRVVTNVVNVSVGVVWNCSTGDGGVFFTEIFTNAGGNAKSGRVGLICPPF